VRWLAQSNPPDSRQPCKAAPAPSELPARFGPANAAYPSARSRSVGSATVSAGSESPSGCSAETDRTPAPALATRCGPDATTSFPNNVVKRGMSIRTSTLKLIARAAQLVCIQRDPQGSTYAWARLKKFCSADSARLRWLTEGEATRLQNACSPDLRALVRAGLLTGCRVGELLALRGGDFDPRSKTLLIADSKNGKPRRVPLTDHGVTLFEDQTAGKLENEPLFTRTDGSPWYRMAVVRAMRAACIGGKIIPPATFHTIRHYLASLTM
jgi:Phage integrase family